MSDYPEVDRFLELQGKALDGKPLYRLIWSSNAFEWRKGVFRDFYGSIFLREYVGAKYVPKYSYLPSRWILEKYFPDAHSEALPVYDRYEPIFAFQDKDCNPLPVSLKMVELLVGFDRRSERRGSENNALEDQTMFEKLDEKEFNQILDSIDSSPIASLLHTKEGIVRP